MWLVLVYSCSLVVIYDIYFITANVCHQFLQYHLENPLRSLTSISGPYRDMYATLWLGYVIGFSLLCSLVASNLA